MKKTVILLLVLFATAENAKAANVYMWNPSDHVSSNSFINSYNDNGQEGFDVGDSHFLNAPYTPRLEITSNEPGFRAEWNNKPKNTPYSEADFKVKGEIIGPIPNSVTFYVEDTEGFFDHRDLIAYNVADPNTIYRPTKTHGVVTTFDIPDVENLEDEVYATWRIETPPLVQGDIASSSGVGILDGVTDIYDLQALASLWLEETFVGENYDWSDINYDRNTNYLDFPTNWLESEPI